MARCLATFRGKHQDYGSSIGFHGAEGLMPRIADKFFRLNHMVWEGNIPNFESAIDSAEDLVVYVTILAAVLRTMGVASELEG